MTKWRVYQQRPPKEVQGSEVGLANIVFVTEMEGVDGASVIAKAKRLLPFVQAKRGTLARYPIVEEV